jgi:transcription elongation factor S-II
MYYLDSNLTSDGINLISHQHHVLTDPASLVPVLPDSTLPDPALPDSASSVPSLHAHVSSVPSLHAHVSSDTVLTDFVSSDTVLPDTALPDSISLNSTPQKPPINFITKLSKNIEKGIFNYAIKESTNRKIIKKWENRYFVQLYLDRLKTVFVNLKTNPILVQKLVIGEITPEIFAFMTHQEMCPDQWNDLIALKIKRDESKYVNRVEASTDMYQCRKCKSRKCTYYSVQVRSADEPMSVFITCSNCSHNFRD